MNAISNINVDIKALTYILIGIFYPFKLKRILKNIKSHQNMTKFDIHFKVMLIFNKLHRIIEVFLLNLLRLRNINF